jgi:hypothetical protein
VFATTLMRGTKPAGRLLADCVGVDLTYKGLECSLGVIFGDGRLALQGGYLGRPVKGVGGRREEHTVAGGTGAYADATGTMRRKGNGKRDTITFTRDS